MIVPVTKWLIQVSSLVRPVEMWSMAMVAKCHCNVRKLKVLFF